ncbi:hypothetical protein B0T10DRAFT_552006 [Thelonectria olida]|uniref:Uncharacterized protein n=1 Tax=Thelonectria olida TaxID=1576542 RepID=A0A9P8VVS0_9HYPO|nr:hypothetical protein B0T10DRAFT_552006 [Thelonectria olida]
MINGLINAIFSNLVPLLADLSCVFNHPELDAMEFIIGSCVSYSLLATNSPLTSASESIGSAILVRWFAYRDGIGFSALRRGSSTAHLYTLLFVVFTGLVTIVSMLDSTLDFYQTKREATLILSGGTALVLPQCCDYKLSSQEDQQLRKDDAGESASRRLCCAVASSLLPILKDTSDAAARDRMLDAAHLSIGSAIDIQYLISAVQTTHRVDALLNLHFEN